MSILFLNYFILSKGHKTIFLGQSIPTISLKTMLSYSTELHFLTFITVEPNRTEINNYISEFHQELIADYNNSLSIFGPQTQYITEESKLDGINVYQTFERFIEEQLKTTVFV